jgi:hypothetical protein
MAGLDPMQEAVQPASPNPNTIVRLTFNTSITTVYVLIFMQYMNVYAVVSCVIRSCTWKIPVTFAFFRATGGGYICHFRCSFAIVLLWFPSTI